MCTPIVPINVKNLLVLLAFGLCVVAVGACGGGGGRMIVDTGRMVLSLPSGHGLTTGQFTIPAGATEEHGNVVISCPPGGDACVFTVNADGTASYAKTGGMPSFAAARIAQTLPEGHGLTTGQFTIPAGATEEHGNVVISCPPGGDACVFTVNADGTASYAKTGGMPSFAAARIAQTLPEGHGLTTGQFTIPAGATEEHGNVVISCPPGGDACVFTVNADGTASYAKTGGMPSFAAARIAQTLPEGHGLTGGQFTIPAGATEEHGNVVISCPPGGDACVFTVNADGTASYAKTGGMPSFRIQTVENLTPGPGLLAGNAEPVVASTAADTLQRSLDDADNVFPTLSAGLRRVFVSPSTAALSTDFAVKSIQMNVQGAYVISYILDGTPGTVTITENDAIGQNAYEVAVDGTSFGFWSWTTTLNEPFSRYMDSALLTTRSLTADQFRSWFIFGARTETSPTTGSATYLGRFLARAYRADDPRRSERQHITGAMRLVANFDLNQLQGTIDAIRNRDGSGTRTDWTTSSFEITDGRIQDGQFAATLIGRDSDPNTSFDDSLKGFTGSVLGEFYGPNADEVGAVVSAERVSVGPEYGRILYGYVEGKNIEPYSQAAVATGLHPLSGRVFGSGKKALIVMAHGLVSGGGPSHYMYQYAQDIANQLPDVTVAAVLRPGYFDAAGRVSPGSNHERSRDQYTAENNRYLATTIQNLKSQISPEKVLVVGHSAGAIHFSTLIGQYKKLVDAAVLVAGTYDLAARGWVNSQSPLDFVDTIDRSVKVIATSGTEDTGTPPSVGREYVQMLRDNGVDAEFVLIKGAEHSYNQLHTAVTSTIGEVLNQLVPGLGQALIDDENVGRFDSAALVSGVYRDSGTNSTTFSALGTPTVESTADGFRITYVVDGQTQIVELNESDFGANPSRPHDYSKTTDGTEFRLDLNFAGFRFEHLAIDRWSIYPFPGSMRSSRNGVMIYGTRTADMPTAGTANYTGNMRAWEWPTDAVVGTSSSQVTHFRGDLSLTADFGNPSVSGNATGLESRRGDRSSYGNALGGLNFNGTIDGNGISAADLSGSGVLTHYSNGSVNGAFYGPGAKEVGGVFEAADTTANKLLTGFFVGEKQ